MTISPPTADPDRPRAEPLVIGPVRGFWQAREPNRWFWIALLGPFAAALAVGLLEREIDSRMGNRAAGTIGIVLLAASILGPLVCAHRSSIWGDAYWRIDDQGVSVIRPGGERTFLAWDDVEQVRRPDCTDLRGRGVQVRFNSNIPEADRREIEQRIRARLKDDFDIDRRPPRTPTVELIRLLATWLAWMTAFLATACGPMLIQDFGGPRIGWIGKAACLGWMVLLLAYVGKEFRRFDAELWIPRRSVDVAKEAKPEIRP